MGKPIQTRDPYEEIKNDENEFDFLFYDPSKFRTFGYTTDKKIIQDFDSQYFPRIKKFLYALYFELVPEKIKLGKLDVIAGDAPRDGNKYIGTMYKPVWNTFSTDGYVPHYYPENFNDKKKIAIEAYSAIKTHYKRRFQSPRKPRKYGKQGFYDFNDVYYTVHLINSVCGLNQKLFTKVLYLDFDYDNSLELWLKLKDKEFGDCDELLIEQSATGRLHVALQLNYHLNDYEIDCIIKGLNNKYNLDIEARKSTKVFRLPAAHNYRVGRIRHKKFVPFKKFNTVLNSVLEFKGHELDVIPLIQKYIRDKKAFNYFRYRSNLTETYLVANYPNIKDNEYTNIDLNSITADKPFVWHNKYKREGYVQHEYNTLEHEKHKKKKFKITAGKRVKTLYNEGLGFYAISQGVSSAQEFYNFIKKYDYGSKDLALPYDRALKICERDFNFFYKNFNTSYKENTYITSASKETTETTEYYQDNTKYIPDKALNLIEKHLSIFSHMYLTNNVYKYPKCKQNAIQSLRDEVLNIFGRIFFEIQTDFKRGHKKQGYIFYRFKTLEKKSLANNRKLFNLFLEKSELFTLLDHSVKFNTYGIKRRYVFNYCNSKTTMDNNKIDRENKTKVIETNLQQGIKQLINTINNNILDNKNNMRKNSYTGMWDTPCNIYSMLKNFNTEFNTSMINTIVHGKELLDGY